MPLRRVLLGLFTGVLLATTLGAQSSKPCMIFGTVVGPSREPIAGVSLEATSNVNGDQPHAVTSDADGKFKLENLPSGVYTLTADFPGYISFKQEGINLTPGLGMSMIMHLRPAPNR